MSATRPLESPLFDPRHSRRRAVAVMAALLALHIVTVWGYADLYWAEQGSWLNDVERFAQGQRPYSDFQWQHPPLAIWVLGSLAKVFGTGLAAVSAVTTLVTIMLFAAYLSLASLVAPGTTLPAVATGVVFATAYSSRFGPPLPLGGQSPGGPLGMLMLLAALVMVVQLPARSSRLRAAGIGALCALAALSRADYWIPSLLLAAWSVAMLRHLHDRWTLARWLLGTMAATLLAALAAVIAQGGEAVLATLLSARPGDDLLRVLPSWERLTVELAAVAAMGIAGVVALWLCFALEDTRAARLTGLLLFVFLSACAVYLGVTTSLAQSIAEQGPGPSPTPLEEGIAGLVTGLGRHPFRAALYLLDQRFQQHLFPFLLPPILVGILAWRWRRWPDHHARDIAALLLGLSIALRLRRGFGGADWSGVLLEIPAYALFLHLVASSAGRQAQRSVSVALAILFVVGLYTYWESGRGVLSARRYPELLTARGRVHWPAAEAGDYQALRRVLDELDPGGRRPLLAFGRSGGWNYYFARPSVTRLTSGFVSEKALDGVLVALRNSELPAFIVDNRSTLRIDLPPRPSLGRWESAPPAARGNPLLAPAFDSLLAGCTRVVGIARPPGIPVYDCSGSRPDSPTPPDSSP